MDLGNRRSPEGHVHGEDNADASQDAGRQVSPIDERGDAAGEGRGTTANDPVQTGKRWIDEEDIRQIAALFQSGFNLRETMDNIGFVGGYQAFKDATRALGYVVTRKLVQTNTRQRTWGKRQTKLTPEQAEQIDRWLMQEHIPVNGIARLCRVHGIAMIRDGVDLNNLLYRSGYGWRYAFMTIELERELKRQGY